MGADHQESGSVRRLSLRLDQIRQKRPDFLRSFFAFVSDWADIQGARGEYWQRPLAIMIRSTKDLWSGLIYIFFGATAIILGRDYGMGSALKMGAAYFPTLLGWLLVLIGAIALVRAFVVQGSPIGSVAIKGLLLVVGSVLFFGLLVRGAGMVAALPLLVVSSAIASSRFRWTPTLLMAAGLTVFCVLVFLKGLGIPLPVVGPWLGG